MRALQEPKVPGGRINFGSAGEALSPIPNLSPFKPLSERRSSMALPKSLPVLRVLLAALAGAATFAGVWFFTAP